MRNRPAFDDGVPVWEILLECGRATRVAVLGIVNLPDRRWVVGRTRDGRVVKGKPLPDPA